MARRLVWMSLSNDSDFGFRYSARLICSVAAIAVRASWTFTMRFFSVRRFWRSGLSSSIWAMAVSMVLGRSLTLSAGMMMPLTTTR